MASSRSWRSRNGSGRSRSATCPPSPATLHMPRRYQPNSSARRWAPSRTHPKRRFRRALELALATGPRWRPESLCEREGSNLQSVSRTHVPAVSTRAGFDDQMTSRPGARPGGTTRDPSQPLQIPDPIEFLYPTPVQAMSWSRNRVHGAINGSTHAARCRSVTPFLRTCTNSRTSLSLKRTRRPSLTDGNAPLEDQAYTAFVEQRLEARPPLRRQQPIVIAKRRFSTGVPRCPLRLPRPKAPLEAVERVCQSLCATFIRAGISRREALLR